MDIFVEKNNSVKAGNIVGARACRIVVDLINDKIEHHIQHELRDADGDKVGFTILHESIDLSSQEFTAWVTAQVVEATRSKINSHINPE